jgi:hypothetical protein
MTDPRMGMLVLHWTPEGLSILCEPTDLQDDDVLTILLTAVAHIGAQLDLPQEEFLDAVQQGLRDAHPGHEPHDG